MNLLLLAFLVVALIITGIGFALSPKSQERNLETDRLMPRDVRRQPRPRPNPQRRSQIETSQKVVRASRTASLPASRTSALPPQRRTSSLPAARNSAALSRYRETTSYPVRALSRQAMRPSFVASHTIELQDETPAGQIFTRINDLFERRHEEPLPWAVAVVGLVSIVILGLALLTNILPHQPLTGYVPFFTAADSSNSSTSSNTPKPTPPPTKYNVSKSLVRLGQLDPNQYATPAEYSIWAYSACSTASMTEVFNAYGRNYRITDVLKVESGIHEITPDLGLLEDIGVSRTAAKFGFKTTWGDSNFSLDQVIKAANSGTPVIVSFPPNRYPDGHLLVVVGGNSSTVFTADSSYYNHKSFSRSQFLKYWGGFYAIATPK